MAVALALTLLIKISDSDYQVNTAALYAFIDSAISLFSW